MDLRIFLAAVFSPLLLVSLTGCPQNQAEDCCSMSGEADPNRMPEGPAQAQSITEDVEVTVWVMTEDGNLNGPLAGPVVATSAGAYQYTVELFPNLLDSRNMVVRATSGSLEGRVSPVNIPETDEVIQIARIDRETTLETKVEAAARAFALTDPAEASFPGTPSRAFVRLGVRSSQALSLTNPNDAALINDLGRGSVRSESGRYLAYRALWEAAGSPGVSFEAEVWNDVLEAARLRVEAGDTAGQVDEAVNDQVEQDIATELASLPLEASFDAPCLGLLAKQVQSSLELYNVPPSVATGEFDVLRAEHALAVLNVHEVTWNVFATEFEALTGVPPPTGGPGPANWLANARAVMQAIVDGTPIDTIEGGWGKYDIDSQSWVGMWLDDSMFGDMGTGANFWAPVVLNTSPPLGNLQTELRRTDNGLGADTSHNLHNGLFDYYSTELDVQLPPSSALLPPGSPQIRLLACAAFMSTVNRPLPAQ